MRVIHSRAEKNRNLAEKAAEELRKNLEQLGSAEDYEDDDAASTEMSETEQETQKQLDIMMDNGIPVGAYGGAWQNV